MKCSDVVHVMQCQEYEKKWEKSEFSWLSDIVSEVNSTVVWIIVYSLLSLKTVSFFSNYSVSWSIFSSEFVGWARWKTELRCGCIQFHHSVLLPWHLVMICNRNSCHGCLTMFAGFPWCDIFSLSQLQTEELRESCLENEKEHQSSMLLTFYSLCYLLCKENIVKILNQLNSQPVWWFVGILIRWIKSWLTAA